MPDTDNNRLSLSPGLCQYFSHLSKQKTKSSPRRIEIWRTYIRRLCITNIGSQPPSSGPSARDALQIGIWLWNLVCNIVWEGHMKFIQSNYKGNILSKIYHPRPQGTDIIVKTLFCRAGKRGFLHGAGNRTRLLFPRCGNIRMSPVFELVTAICHWHIAFNGFES